MSDRSLTPDPSLLRAFWDVMVAQGDVYELRLPDTRRGPARLFATTAGYFDDPEACVRALAHITGEDAPAVYMTLNPVRRDLLARAVNRLRTKVRATTSDVDIRTRRHFLIDVDPIRPADISATDGERDAALAVRDAIRAYLTDLGFPDPAIVGMSGNGGSLTYRIDLPNDEESLALVTGCLAALAVMFGTDAVSIDRSVANAARITKVIGTVAAKGDDCPELGRPWRLATAEFPPGAAVVPQALLEALAAHAEVEDVATERQDGRGIFGPVTDRPERRWTVAELLTRNGIGWTERRRPYGTAYQLDRCLTSSDHLDGASIIENDAGRLGYVCHHNRCQGKAWRDVRAALGLGEPDGRAGAADHAADGAGGADGRPATSKAARDSQADRLIAIGREAELFHDRTGDTYARLSIGGHRECWPTRSKGFRRWLAHAFYTRYRKAAGAQATADALGVLEARAQFEGECHAVHLRTAPDGRGGLYLDLGDPSWRAAHVTADGWELVAAPPVYFRRSPGLLALPEPVRDGSLDELRTFVNVPDDDDWALVKAWPRAAVRDRGPYPVLALYGEHGSAKTTLARMLRALTDPAAPALRSNPREQRDLAIAARACWVIGLDNVSHIQAWLSDALCCLATGAGWATRELYSDWDEVLFEAQRPVVLTGITEYITRGDLLDRTLQVTLAAIPDDRRRDEAGLWAAFDEAHPRLLGALLDDVAAAMRELPDVRLERLPRMADFTRWVVAAERGRCERPRFLKAYAGAVALSHEQAVEASIIGPALLAFIGKDVEREPWTGTAGDLLKRLAELADDQTRRAKDWPQSPRGLSGELRRLAPALRGIGLTIQFDLRDRSRCRSRLLRIARGERVEAQQSEPSASADGRPQPERDESRGAYGRGAQADGREADADGRADGPTRNEDGADGSAATVSAWAGATQPDDWEEV